ncbi:Growth-regulating factor 5 [Sesamum angolense]|uniref:Growth-regulating factor n=1 Tax=Sesamum angolense TaxID=2727404 RepID=A0AAE1WEV3_9LAMI|nr:Growth-regulating factor 5 [Sesamum angolense]
MRKRSIGSLSLQPRVNTTLVFKYMASGMPIPQDLLFTIRTSLDSSLSSKFLLHHQPHHSSLSLSLFGWNGFHMGFGRKVDPEPGRCRKNRWKKNGDAQKRLIQIPSTAKGTCTEAETVQESLWKFSHKPQPKQSTTHQSPRTHSPPWNPTFLIPISNSSRPPGISFSSQENPVGFFLESNSAYSSRSPAKITEPNSNPNSGTTRSISDNSSVNIDSSWQLVPLTMGSTYSSGLENRQLQILTGQHNHDQNHYYSTDRF